MIAALLATSLAAPSPGVATGWAVRSEEAVLASGALTSLRLTSRLVDTLDSEVELLMAAPGERLGMGLRGGLLAHVGDKAFSPHVSVGFGGVTYRYDDLLTGHVALAFGVGSRVRLSDTVELRTDLRLASTYLEGVTVTDDEVEMLIGVTWTPPRRVVAVADADIP